MLPLSLFFLRSRGFLFQDRLHHHHRCCPAVNRAKNPKFFPFSDLASARIDNDSIWIAVPPRLSIILDHPPLSLARALPVGHERRPRYRTATTIAYVIVNRKLSLIRVACINDACVFASVRFGSGLIVAGVWRFRRVTLRESVWVVVSFTIVRRRLARKCDDVGIKERASSTAPRPGGSPSGIHPASAARRCSRPSSRICSSLSPPRCPPADCSNTRRACRISPGNRRTTLCFSTRYSDVNSMCKNQCVRRSHASSSRAWKSSLYFGIFDTKDSSASTS